jgi:benzylsuccinate CoA-transferase BbsF subunit
MSKLPLEGLRVADLTWVLAGPLATRILADFGAQVIKIESHVKMDGLRFYGPWRDGERMPPEIGCGFYDLYNRNKLDICLNLTNPKGVEIFKRLIKISDVVVENFSARGMKKFGLEYPVLREINPQLIMISMAGMGHTGPYRDYISFGPVLQAMSGLSMLAGFPNSEPVGIGNSYPDHTAAIHATFAIMIALEYRRKTGKGQYIDLSQLETAAVFLGTQILDYVANSRVAVRDGNRHPYASPHGCYRCQGNDRWCAIAVFGEEEWQRFCEVIDNPPWCQDPKFATTLDRVRNANELDKLIETWTIHHSPEEVMKKLQNVGIAAGVVQNIEDLMVYDLHLQSRGFYEEIDMPLRGKAAWEGMQFKLSETPGSVRVPAPFLGQDQDYVQKEILGMSIEEIEQCESEGAFD